MICPRRGCGTKLELTKTILPTSPRMAYAMRSLNTKRRFYRCPVCGYKGATLELLDIDLDKGGFLPEQPIGRVRP